MARDDDVGSRSSEDDEWTIGQVAAGQRGDLFAVLATREEPLKRSRSSPLWTPPTVHTVVARGSFRRRRFLGAAVVEGYEHVLAIVDAGGGPPVLIVAHSRAEAPLEGFDLESGARLWTSPAFRGAWALTAGRDSRNVGASYRGSAKVISVETGKLRWSWPGDIHPLIPDGDYVVALKDTRRGSTELHRIVDGSNVFKRANTETSDAAISRDVLVVAGHGLVGYSLEGEPLWSFDPETYFSAVVGLPFGFRALCARCVVELRRDGTLVRELARPVDAECFLGPELVIWKQAISSIESSEAWDFTDALRACAADALQRLSLAQTAEPADVAAHTPPSQRVRHLKFGLGTIVQERDDKTWVKFDDGIERTIAARFLAREDE